MQRATLWKNLKSLASTIAFVWLFTNHIAQATVVPSESMEPTILVGDHFFLDKVGFAGNYPAAIQKLLPERTIQRGDIVAFWSPELRSMRLVKRVIGLPGETIEVRGGIVYIDGKRLAEPYAVHAYPGIVQRDFGPAAIPADHFFMMGDNRDNSRDSRYWGLVDREDLIGKPLFVYWSYETDAYPQEGSPVKEWLRHYASVATHFIANTRWSRTGTALR